MKTILEFIANKKPTKPKYKYHPKTKEELIENIKAELKAGNQDLNCIDTYEIIDMSDIFCVTNGGIKTEGYSNIDISEWDVSNVKDTSFMFEDAEFDCDLSKWDVSNVENMAYMFFHSYFTTDKTDFSVWNLKSIPSKYQGDVVDEMFYSTPMANIYGKTPKIENGKFVKK